MKLKAKKRDLTGKKVKNLRSDKKVPAAIYGPERDSENIVVTQKEVRKIFKKTGYNQIFDLEIEGENPVKALIKEIQINPITDQYLHVSLYQIDMKKKILVEVPVVIEGQSKAVKSGIGFLVTPVEAIPLVCLPSNIPNQITVDVTPLVEINDAISVSDIDLPSDVELEANFSEESVLARIVPPQKMIVEETEEDEDTEDEGEGIEGEGVEGEEGEPSEESEEPKEGAEPKE